MTDYLRDNKFHVGANYWASKNSINMWSDWDESVVEEDFRKLSNVKSALKRRWENYLKGSEPMHRLTFMSETASKERKAFFITPMHPLVKQAAKYYATNQVAYIHLKYY